jgi:TIR domain
MRKFENDVFISYAHIDNQPLGDGEKGWVTRFHAILKPMLFGRMGRQVKFWRDDKLQGNDIFSNEIVHRFKQSAVLVSIVTPRYLKSEWCTKEAHEFCRSAQETGGLEVDNKSRVFKVLKLPVAHELSEALPPPMRELLGYEFYAVEGGVALELGSEYGEKYVQLLNKNTARLAAEIKVLLETKEAEANASTADDRNGRNEPRVPSKPAVYLAECSFDRREDRAALKAELQSRNYQVLPDRELPREEADYRTEVARLLDQCRQISRRRARRRKRARRRRYSERACGSADRHTGQELEARDLVA